MVDQANQTQGTTEPKLVPEKDLLALKSKAEGLEQKLKEAEASHSAVIEGHKKQLDEVTTKLYATEASVKKLEEQLTEGAKSTKDLAEVKTKLEAAEKRLGDLSSKALDYRKKLILATFKIPAEVIKDKSLEQLDLYEEALKAVSATSGAGNYAITVGAGGGNQTLKPRERIRAGFDTLHPADK